MNRPIHFEILGDDPANLATFYGSLFGWETASWEGDDQPYWLVTTGPEDAPGINGGIMHRHFKQAVINTIEVESLPKTLEKVTGAGGKTVSGPDEIPDVGLHAYCADPEGNLFGILEPLPQDE